jgi:hypothetical protein
MANAINRARTNEVLRDMPANLLGEEILNISPLTL